MKLKIKVKVLTEGCAPVITSNGDLIDLRAAKDYEFSAPQAGVQYQKGDLKYRDVTFDEQIISLGVAMELPNGMMAKLKGRSSLTKRYGVVMSCSGEIDNSYKGNSDEWKLRVFAIRKGKIDKLDRIAQFEVVPSQKATFLQKLRWLLSSGVKIEIVDNLNNENRGGFGSSGVK